VGLDREALDRVRARKSFDQAAAAIKANAFAKEIIPVRVTLADGSEILHDRDEGVRLDASAEALGKLEPISPGGVITAGNASQICDGSSALLVASERAVKLHGFKPLARVVNMTMTAGVPRA